MKRNTILCLIILGIPVLLGFVSAAVQGWHCVFDDAFITFRYAKNLALGHGITWNPGHAPTEGYTNFLLVVFLAPFIRAGADPLLVTRVLSYLSAVAMAAILFAVAKRRHGCSTPAAVMMAALILFVPQTRDLCLVGLETVIYALFLLVTFHVGVGLLHSERTLHSVLFSALVFLTVLLRPEAALIYPVALALFCIRRGAGRTLDMKPLVLGLLVLLALGGTYLGWKALHFGHLLPNPFHLKASSSALVSRTGAVSVFEFIHANALLLALAYASVLYCLAGTTDHQKKSRLSIALGLGLIAVYACFYARTDTLMDIDGRFMYPLVPIVIYLAIPALAAALAALESRVGGRALGSSGIAVAFLLAFAPLDILRLCGNVKRLTPDNEWKTGNTLMQKELRIAQELSLFPGIERLRIAFGDSGVIPYFTGAIWLDVVGLNDGTIARTRDKEQLINHFFGFQPDLVIHPGRNDFSWITNGHGPLGDYASWSSDPRWDEYLYAGTSRTDGSTYDLQYFVRSSSPYCESLKSFMQTSVVDGRYEPLPFGIGTWVPDKNTPPAWIPQTEQRG